MTETTLAVSEVKFSAASGREEHSGLLGYVSFVLGGGLLLDGLTLRRSADGKTYLAYPTRTDRAGRRHALSRPLDDESRQQIERQVFNSLGIGEATP